MAPRLNSGVTVPIMYWGITPFQWFAYARFTSICLSASRSGVICVFCSSSALASACAVTSLALAAAFAWSIVASAVPFAVAIAWLASYCFCNRMFLAVSAFCSAVTFCSIAALNCGLKSKLVILVVSM